LARAELPIDGTTDAEPPETLTKGTVFQTLSNTRRRYVVHDLLQHEEPRELGALAKQVAAWENEKTIQQVTSAERRRVYNALQQVHLPRMDEDGLVRYDAARGTVEPTAELVDLRVYLEIIPGNDIPWSQYYVILGLFCGSLVLAATVQLYPFDQLSGLTWADLTVILFTVSGLAHAYYSHRMRLGAGGSPPEA